MARVLVFDSGLGGLSVLAALRGRMPQASYVYVADTGFYPYGTKSEAQLLDRLPSLLESLGTKYAPDLIVIACNTASTIALEEIRAAVEVPVVGTVPAIKPAAEISKSGVIGLLGTPGTVRRTYTDDLIKAFAQGAHVISCGAADLVHLAERKMLGEPVSRADMQAGLRGLLEAGRVGDMDVLVLACTHFPLLRDELAAVLSDDVTIIDSGDAIARRAKSLLGEVLDGAQSFAVLTSEGGNLQRLETLFRAHQLDFVDIHK
jgi:glutamate racemase